jgi:hypothetical protein
MILIPLSIEKCIFACWFGAPLSHLTCCTYTSTFLSQLSRAKLPYTDSSHSMSQISCPFSLVCVVYPKNPSKSEALCDISQQAYFLWWGVVSLTPNHQAGGSPLVGCPRLLIKCIRSYPPYPEAVSSICNLRTRRAGWQGTHFSRTHADRTQNSSLTASIARIFWQNEICETWHHIHF